MASSRTETRFTPDLDLEGLSPDEAFAVLGNEIRLEISRVLRRTGALRGLADHDGGGPVGRGRGARP